MCVFRLRPSSARKWNDAMREAREDLAMDRKLRLGGRGGDAAPPRLSASGFGSLARLLRQRVRADEVGGVGLARLDASCALGVSNGRTGAGGLMGVAPVECRTAVGGLHRLQPGWRDADDFLAHRHRAYHVCLGGKRVACFTAGSAFCSCVCWAGVLGTALNPPEQMLMRNPSLPRPLRHT